MIIPDLNIKLISSGCWLLVAGYWKFEKKVKKSGIMRRIIIKLYIILLIRILTSNKQQVTSNKN
jgi:predicted membrane protein